jgi:transposase
LGLEAKTDRVDTAVIARYGEVRRLAPTPLPNPPREKSGEILACRRRLVDEITVRKQQLGHLRGGDVRERVKCILQLLRQEEKELTTLLRRTIQADEALTADFALLTFMPGRGLVLAATLLADMPELGSLDRRKAAALAGLAPVARDRGLRENRRVIKGGRGYMAAVASPRCGSTPARSRIATASSPPGASRPSSR